MSDNVAFAFNPSPFAVEATTVDGTTSVRVSGELDMATAPELRRVLESALEGPPERLAVDLRELTFTDSTGIRELVSAGHRAAACGCAFVLRFPSRSVLKALRLTGFDQLLDIEVEGVDA